MAELKDLIRAALGGEYVSGGVSRDNLTIALHAYFQTHQNYPPGLEGWRWADAKTDEALDRLTAAVMRVIDAHEHSSETEAVGIFEQCPVGTLFQKKPNGSVIALLPDGSTWVARSADDQL